MCNVLDNIIINNILRYILSNFSINLSGCLLFVRMHLRKKYYLTHCAENFFKSRKAPTIHLRVSMGYIVNNRYNSMTGRVGHSESN